MRALFSLLFSTTLLLLGHGMQLTLLPLRASLIGHSEQQIAIAGSAYFAGFVIGCLYVPRIIARVGHIRSFAVLASAMSSCLLLIGLLEHWLVWCALRFMVGIFICGLYTVIESWLNDQATTENRGQILSVYTFLVLSAMAGGQQLIGAAPLSSATPFMLVAVVISLSILPVGLTRKLAPAPIESTRSRITFLFRRSPTAAYAAVLSGAITGSFWSLGALYARTAMGSLEAVALFMSIAILGGAALQYPLGWLSDRVGRKFVLLGLGVAGALASAFVALGTQNLQIMIGIFLFGAFTMPAYSMALATAADNSLRHEFIQVGTSVLLLNALGAVAAPLVVGQLMTLFGTAWLFWGCAIFSVGYAVLVAVFFNRAPRVDDVVPFAAASSAMAPTSFDMDPRAPFLADGDLAPAEELHLDETNEAADSGSEESSDQTVSG